ncbi:MAG: hypothetical protein V4739_12870 [Pseudomonadota bacterium]
MMNTPHKILASALALSTLVACGGGGDDNDDEPADQRYTQADVKNVAASGVNVLTDLTSVTGLQGVGFLSGFLQGLSGDVGGGTRVLNLNGACTSGAASASVTKAATRTGFAIGDQVTLTFDKCLTSGFLVQGTARLTPRAVVATRAAGEVDVNFEARATGFSVAFNGMTVLHEGVAEIKATANSSGVIGYAITVPSGQQWGVVLSGQATSRTTLGSNTALLLTQSTTPNTMTKKLDGAISAGTPQQRQYQVNTPTPLSGSVGSSGQFVPTAGQITTNHLAARLDTSTTVSAGNVTVVGDTDQNGSLDLSFTTTWTGLTAP